MAYPFGVAAGAAAVAAAFSLLVVWPLNCRVAANSPSLWPTMFSVMYTGMNFFPLCTAIVWPIISGTTVERRDHVLTTFLSPARFMISTFSSRCRSMNGPFFSDLLMSHPGARCRAPLRYFGRRCTMNRSLGFRPRVLYPLVGTPQGGPG